MRRPYSRPRVIWKGFSDLIEATTRPSTVRICPSGLRQAAANRLSAVLRVVDAFRGRTHFSDLPLPETLSLMSTPLGTGTFQDEQCWERLAHTETLPS